MPGYEGIACMATPEGKGLVVSFWENEEASRRGGAGRFDCAVEEFVTVYRALPGRERYRVVYAEMPG